MVLDTKPGSAIESFGKQLRLDYQPESFLRFVHEPGSVVQLFVKEAKSSSNRHLVGYYDSDHFEKLSHDVQQHSGQATGIFYGLNPVSPSCLDRAKNCLKPSREAKAAQNSDILRRRIMLIDIDPVREPGCSATEEEKAVAYWLGRIVCCDLRQAGWPKPVVVDSGNGFHLLYRVDLPADDDGLIRDCLRALATRYDCEEAKIDTSVFDAKRLAKFPGTMTCKGKASQERPHRLSGSFRLPKEFTAVPESLLGKLASQAPPRPEQVAVQNQAPIQVGDTAKQIANARAYLKKMDPAISGQNGRNQFLNAACRLVDDFALSAEQARPLLDEYNQRCVPPFDANGVDDKLSSALAKVADRGGPSGVALQILPKMSSKPAAEFVGFVPDFGLVDKNFVLHPADRKPLDGFWVWSWLLWRSLRSDALVPDVMLRQWYWGADYGRNWKARLKKNIRLRPVKKPDCSSETCMFFGSGAKHDHFSLSIKSYGLLDLFCSPEQRQPGQLRVFDVYGDEHKEQREKLQKEGHLFNVYWPALVLGSSRKVGWSWPQQRLVVGMVRELTRRRRGAGEDIAGEIIAGGLVAASKDTSQKTTCLLLDPKHECVAFAGNGNRKGRGYQLVGRTGKGWIHRAGYLNAPSMNAKERVDALKSFLSDLESLSQDLGLIPAAVNQGQWKSLDEMIDCTRTGRGREWLECCTMRIYTLADWRHRWRKFFSEKLGFEWIPASPEDACETAALGDAQEITSSNQLKKWLAAIGWTQQRLADEIAAITGKKCSLRRVQRHLACTSRAESFFEEVDLVRRQHPKATLEVTNVG
jgi:hypothetical protein